MGVRHHHGHQGAAAAGAGTGDVMGRLAWRHGRSRAPFRPWRAVHQPRVHHQGRGVRHASLDRHGRRLVRQRHGRERRRRVQDRARLATQALPGFEGPGIGDVPVGLVVELEASAPVLGLQDTGTDRNRVLCKPSGASRPTIRAEQKSGHIKLTKISGNVTIPDGTVLTGDNTAEFLLNKVYVDYPVSMQDALFAQVAEQTVGSMFSNVDLAKLTKVAQLMGSMAEGRHFSMYAFDETAEKTISDAGFTAQTPSSEEHPQVGVYVTEQNPSKMGWYIHRTSKVTRSTCDNDGSPTYHVEYTMTNTLESSQIGALTSYILGSGGQGVEKTLIYAPAGGSISNLKTSGGSVTESRQETLNGKTVYASNATIAPGESVTYSFDVTTSTKAVSDLTIDQTPMGWIDSGVTTDTAACSINKQ